MVSQSIAGSAVTVAATGLVTVHKNKNQRLQRCIDGAPAVNERKFDPVLVIGIEMLQGPERDFQPVACCDSFDYVALEKTLPSS